MDLYEAFGLSPGAIVAAVGGGGKTSLVFGLALEAASRGLSAVVSTTTKFTRPPGAQMHPVVETTDGSAAEDLARAIVAGTVVVAISGHGDHRRMHGFTTETFGQIAALAPGIITIEADGSANRPFKAPATHEPVIPDCVTDVVVCVGLSVLGHQLGDAWVQRSELAAVLADVPVGALVTPDVVARVMLHPNGGRRAVPVGARLHALLNNPASTEQERLAVHIGQRLVYGGYSRAIVASAHVAGDIRAILR